ncbi:Chemotaxis regulator - transmits chemoreceptor signals to flagelllar motor components CheY [Paramagnetospirillum magnetotacticum MS-1]|uniref:Chemotaxis regulator-transmits chemoreceptor signals to flagelllar motor components CheY n=2 Tax=Paramagnetospirillum magnetotacticum TaxID=188 RepID=A0A0C2V5L4_PARME|nr:Chemotaxis regulator - transmits chemoreceptor signals to flagelllar motor components CheY [Paramagnetospirillum magnetotacticum MS-1]
MTFNTLKFPPAMAAVLTRTRDYLQEEIGLKVSRAKPRTGNVDSLQLRDITAVVCTDGPIKLMIVFSFQRVLLEHIREVVTARLKVLPEERELFLRETAGETVNFILGHATADLAETGNVMHLSPPSILDEERNILRPKKAIFTTIEMATSHGILDINFIGPSELFDQKLNVIEEEETQGGEMHPLKVLIVDDSLLTVRTLTGMLTELGHLVVQTAGSGALALEAYRRSKPDLVTMDITMPDMDGIEATSGILKEFPEANIIMVTSHGQQGMVMNAVKAGAKGYVLKPIKLEKLRDMIARVFKT